MGGGMRVQIGTAVYEKQGDTWHTVTSGEAWETRNLDTGPALDRIATLESRNAELVKAGRDLLSAIDKFEFHDTFDDNMQIKSHAIKDERETLRRACE